MRYRDQFLRGSFVFGKPSCVLQGGSSSSRSRVALPSMQTSRILCSRYYPARIQRDSFRRIVLSSDGVFRHRSLLAASRNDTKRPPGILSFRNFFNRRFAFRTRRRAAFKIPIRIRDLDTKAEINQSVTGKGRKDDRVAVFVARY